MIFILVLQSVIISKHCSNNKRRKTSRDQRLEVGAIVDKKVVRVQQNVELDKQARRQRLLTDLAASKVRRSRLGAWKGHCNATLVIPIAIAYSIVPWKTQPPRFSMN